MNNIRELAYKSLKEAGASFGYFPITIRSRTKRNSLNAKGVQIFPPDEWTLERWLKYKDRFPIGELYKLANTTLVGENNLLTEPYNTLVVLEGTRVFVFDCDVKNGKQGYENLKRLFKEAFQIVSKKEIDPEVYFKCVNRTPSGGYHIYFSLQKRYQMFQDNDLGSLWGPEYSGIEIRHKQGLMFSGVYLEVHPYRVKSEGNELEPSVEFTAYKVEIKGKYELERWSEEIPYLPEEVYKYLELLNVQHSKVMLNRGSVYYTGGLKYVEKNKNRGSKLYQRIIKQKEKIHEGERFNVLKSLAGYLVVKSRTYLEAEKTFRYLAEKYTDPPYPKDSPKEFEYLVKILQRLWEKNYGGLVKENPKYNTTFEIKSKEDIPNVISLLSEHGVHFLRHSITQELIIRFENLDGQEIVINGEKIPNKLVRLMQLTMKLNFNAQVSRRFIEELIYGGEKYFTEINFIKELWKEYPLIREEKILDNFLEELVSKEYPEEIRARIKELMKKWFVLVYKRSIGEGWNPTMLILVGKQQIGKGYFINNLLPEEYMLVLDDVPENGNKREFNKSQISRILVHFDDAIPHFRKKIEKWQRLKSFITMNKVTWVPKHENREITSWQTLSYVATTNDQVFLPDYENKRFFVVKVRNYDKKYYIPPKKFWGIIKYIAEEKHPEWVTMTPKDQEFIEMLSKAHVESRDIEEGVFNNFKVLKVRRKEEAIKVYKELIEAEAIHYPKLALLPITMLKNFLIKYVSLKPKNGEIKNMLAHNGYREANVWVGKRRIRWYCVIPLTRIAYDYIEEDYLLAEGVVL